MSFRLYYPIGILKLVLKFIDNYCFHIYSAPLGSKTKTFYTDANQEKTKRKETISWYIESI